MKSTNIPIKILNISFTSTTNKEVLNEVSAALSQKNTSNLLTIATLNTEQVYQAYTDDTFRHTLEKFSFTVADSVGVVQAAKFLSKSSIELIPGIDLAETLVKDSINKNLTVLCLGSKLNLTQITHLYSTFKTTSKNLIYTAGYKQIQKPHKNEDTQILSLIKTHKPQLVLVGFGAPHQEKWLIQNSSKLSQLGVKVGMVVGGSFDIWGGRLKRAPKIIRKLKLEWLFRLFQEPTRIKRQLRLVSFAILVLKQKISSVT